MLKNRKVKLAVIALFGWLLVVGFCWLLFVLPIVILEKIAEKGTAALGKELSVRKVALNPFRLAVTVEGVVIAEPEGGAALLAVDEVYANLSIASLWQDGVVVELVRVGAPHIHAVRRADGSLNLTEIGKSPEGVDAEKESAENAAQEPTSVVVERLELVRFAARVDDETVDVRHVIRDLGVTIGRVSTRPEDAGSLIEVDVTATGLNRAELVASVGAKPFAEVPEFRVSNTSFTGCSLVHYLPYVPLPPKLAIASGELNVTNLGVVATLPSEDAPEVAVSVDVELLNLAASEAGAGRLISIPRVVLNLAESKPLAGDIRVSGLSIEDPQVWVERDAEGALNLVRATAPAEPLAGAAADGPGAADQDPVETANDLRIRIDVFELQRLVADIADDAAAAPFRTRLIPVSLTLNAIDTAPGKSGSINLSGESSDGEKFLINGAFSVNPVAFDVRFDGGPFPLAKYSPYYRDLAEIDVVSGAASVGIAVKMGPEKDSGITAYDGRLALNELKLVAREDRRELLAIDSFRIDDIDASTKDKIANIGVIALKDASLAAKRLADEQIDWLTLLPESTASQKQANAGKEAEVEKGQAEEKPFVVNLGKASVENLNLGLADEAVEPVFRTELVVNLSAEKISTAENMRGVVEFEIKEKDGVAFGVSSSVQLNPVAADLTATLGGLQPARYEAYYGEIVNFSIGGGVVAGKLSASLPPEGISALRVTDAEVALLDFSLSAKDADTSFLKLGKLAVSGVAAAMETRQARVGRVHVQNVDLHARRMKDGEIDLIGYLIPTSSPEGIAAPAEKAVSTTSDSSAEPEPEGWVAAVGAIEIEHVRLGVRDLMLETPVDLGIALNGKVLDVSTAVGAKRATMNLGIAFESGGQLTLGGSFGITEQAADLTLGIEDLSVQPFEPYVRDQVNVLLKAGTIWTKGQLAVKASDDDLSLNWKGDSGIRDFAVIDPTNAEPLVKWDEFYVKGVNFDLDPMKVRLEEVALVNPYAGLGVDSEGTLNLQRLLVVDDAASEKGATPAESALEKPTKVESAEEGSLPDVSVGAIRIEGGEFSFRDGMVTPAADHRLGELDFTLGNVSLKDQGLADLKIEGTVGAYANLEIMGKLQPEPLVVDAKIRLAGYQLSPLSPYSGRYIARTIGQGKLGLNLGYEVRGSKIKATNVFLLDKFDLGEKVESKDAVKLPLGLAMALLKDQNGLITLDVPVEGDLNDPEFRVGRVILQVVKNITIKSAASPFKMLGSLTGSDKPLDEMPFAVGSIELGEDAVSRLESLAGALAKRPGLKMSLAGYATEADRDYLKEKAYDALLRGQKAQQLLAAGAGAASADDITLEDAERPELEAAVYLSAGLPELEPLPIVPVSTAETPVTPEAIAEAEAALDKAKADRIIEIREAVRATVEVKDEDLLKLANGRSAAIQGWLKEKGVADERLFLGGADLAVEGEPKVQLKPQE